MTARIDSSDLAALRALCEKATPGPELTRYPHGGGRLAEHSGADGPNLIADFYDESNREFYFAARTALPRLLDEVEGLEADVSSECQGPRDSDERRLSREQHDEPICGAPARWGILTAWMCDRHRRAVDKNDLDRPALSAARADLASTQEKT